jgi:predicted hydrocarbon binding protein
MGRVKGGKISNKLAFLKDNYGEAMIRRVIDSMDSMDQLSLKIILDTAWYEIELYDRLMTAICKTAAAGDESVYTSIGHYSAEQSFTNVYKAFRGKSPEDLLRKIVSMHAMRNDPADMKIVHQEASHCVVRIIEPRSTVVICKVAHGFYVRAVELCGASDVRVKEISCSGKGQPFCQFDLRWN